MYCWVPNSRRNDGAIDSCHCGAGPHRDRRVELTGEAAVFVAADGELRVPAGLRRAAVAELDVGGPSLGHFHQRAAPGEPGVEPAARQRVAGLRGPEVPPHLIGVDVGGAGDVIAAVVPFVRLARAHPVAAEDRARLGFAIAQVADELQPVAVAQAPEVVQLEVRRLVVVLDGPDPVAATLSLRGRAPALKPDIDVRVGSYIA